MKGFFWTIALAFVVSCQKETRNEMKLDGEWQLQHIETYSYDNNVEIAMTDSVLTGTMNLMRTKGIYNDVVFTGWSPFPYSQLNWNTSARKMLVITFHTDGTPGASLFNYSFNIEKHSLNKLVLGDYLADDDLNLVKKTLYYFKK
jgi:hypothetical protein